MDGTSPRVSRWAGVVAVAALLLAACGDDAEPAIEPVESSSAADEEEAAADAVDAVDEGADAVGNGEEYPVPQDGTELSDEDAATIVAALDEGYADTVARLVADGEVTPAVRDLASTWQTPPQLDRWVRTDIGKLRDGLATFSEEPEPPITIDVTVDRAFEDCVELSMIHDLSPLLAGEWPPGASPWAMTLLADGDEHGSETGWRLHSETLVDAATGEHVHDNHRRCER